MSDFDVRGARKAGYSDAEIADFLAAQKGFDAAGARKAGYKDAEIVQHLAPVSMKDNVLGAVGDAADAVATGVNTGVNWLGTQTAKTVAGAVGVPRAVGDVINWTADKANVPVSTFGPLSVLAMAGKHLPTGDEASKAFFDTTGAPEVNLPGKVGKVVDTGVQGLLGSVLTGGTSLPAMGAGLLGGAGSELAGQWAEGSPYEVPARLGGAVLGGVGGAGLGMAVRKGGQAAKAAVEPFTKAGEDKLLGMKLRNVASNPDEAITAIEQQNMVPSSIPNLRLGAGRTSGDGGLMAAEEVAGAYNPGMRGSMVRDNNAALLDALERNSAGMDPRKFIEEIKNLDTGAAMRAQAALDALPPGVDAATAGKAIQDALRGRYNSLVDARKTASDPLYAAARNSDVPIDPVAPWAYAQNIAETGKDKIASFGKRLSRLFESGSETPPQMMSARDALSSIMKESAVVENDNLMRIAKNTLNRVDDALSVVPEELQARSTFAQMSKPLDVYSANKGYPTNAAVIDKPNLSPNYSTPAEKVPGMYLRPGDAGGATMGEFKAAQPSPQALDALKGYAAENVRTGDPLAYLKKNQTALDALDPALTRKVEDVAATQRIAEGFRNSPAGKFLTNDLDAAVKQALGANDSAQRLQAIRMAVGGNPEAVGGLQKAILNDFKSAASQSVPKDAAGNEMLGAAAAARWMKANRDSVSNILTSDQIKALDDITAHLSKSAQPVPGRTGSPTFDRLASESILSAVIGTSNPPTWLHPITKALTLNGVIDIYGGVNKRLMDRMFEVIQDPAVTAALMKKATPANVKMAEPVLARITGQSVPQISQGGRE